MTTIISKELENQWATIRPIFTIRNEREYNAAIKRLNDLLDEVGDNDKHPLFGLLDTLGTLIQVYEEEHIQIPESNGIEVLHYLIEEHQLVQSDLAEIGSQGVVSEVLSGKRELNVRQIRELAKRFHVSPGVFI
jgi:HTH-type transcriptional regulator / antitoxin HigA